MDCTRCHGNTKVVDSRTPQQAENNNADYAHLTMAEAVWNSKNFRSRRRRCKSCRHEFDTIEIPIGEIEA